MTMPYLTICRVALAKKLVREDGYGQLQMYWRSCDAPVFATSLAQVSSCPCELQLTTNKLSEASFCSLYEALSSSCRVFILAVELLDRCLGHLESLIRMLAEDTSLRDVRLGECYYFTGDAVQAAQGLCSKSL